jgi:glycopeptide antibiotics resistance protein
MIQIPGIALLLPVSIIFAVLFIKHSRDAINRLTTNGLIIDLIFTIYTTIVIDLLYFPIIINYNKPIHNSLSVVLVPVLPIFRSIFMAAHHPEIKNITNLLGNMILFFPLSLFMSAYRPNSKRNLFIIILVSSSAEILQLIIMLMTRNYSRVFDVNDLILNTSGAILFYIILNKIKRKRQP